MSTIEGSGRTREASEIFRKALVDAESIDDSGYVLKEEIEATIDKVSKADAEKWAKKHEGVLISCIVRELKLGEFKD